MSGQVNQFSPRHLNPELWSRIGPVARDWVLTANPSTPAVGTAWMNAVTQILAFCDAQGFALDAEVVFKPQVVEHFIAKGCDHLRTGTQANYRSQLRTIGERVLGREACPNRTVAIRISDPEYPYSQAEIAALVSWSSGLTTTFQRHNARVLLALGLGAGLSSVDISVLIGTDVKVHPNAVLVGVPGQNARTVPVLRRWEQEVARAAALSGERPMFRSARERVNRKDISRFIEACRPSDAPKLSIQRTRITWIVHHLSVNTPVRALTAAAGVAPKQLARYYPFVPSTTYDEFVALLRGDE